MMIQCAAIKLIRCYIRLSKRVNSMSPSPSSKKMSSYWTSSSSGDGGGNVDGGGVMGGGGRGRTCGYTTFAVT